MFIWLISDLHEDSDQSEYPFMVSLIMIQTTGFKRLSSQNIQNTVV